MSDVDVGPRDRGHLLPRPHPRGRRRGRAGRARRARRAASRPHGRPPGNGSRTLVGSHALLLAWIVAIVTTAGSLYYSEIVDYIPCELCWYQRICMYPLFAVLGSGGLRRDRSVVWYAAPFVVFGAPVSLYHWLVERVPSLEEGSSCSVFVPCAVPYFEELGYITLAFMALSAFLLVGAAPRRRPRPRPHHREAGTHMKARS